MIISNSTLERRRVGMRCGGGVLVDMPDNTPLHPSQEGNRTAQAHLHRFSITKHINSYLFGLGSCLL